VSLGRASGERGWRRGARVGAEQADKRVAELYTARQAPRSVSHCSLDQRAVHLVHYAVLPHSGSAPCGTCLAQDKPQGSGCSRGSERRNCLITAVTCSCAASLKAAQICSSISVSFAP